MIEPIGNVTLAKQVVAGYFGAPIGAFATHHPSRAWEWPRMLAIWLAYDRCPQHSIPDIADQFRRDQSTAMHAIETVKAYRAQDDLFAALLDRLAEIYTHNAGKPDDKPVMVPSAPAGNPGGNNGDYAVDIPDTRG